MAVGNTLDMEMESLLYNTWLARQHQSLPWIFIVTALVHFLPGHITMVTCLCYFRVGMLCSRYHMNIHKRSTCWAIRLSEKLIMIHARTWEVWLREAGPPTLPLSCPSPFIGLLYTDIILWQRPMGTLKPCTCCIYKIWNDHMNEYIFKSPFDTKIRLKL